MPSTPPRARILAQVRALPQADEVWEVSTGKAPTWIAPLDAPPYRPFLTLVVAAEGPILHSGITEAPASPAAVVADLVRVMHRPPPQAGPARRPTLVTGRDLALLAALAAPLTALGIHTLYRATLLATAQALAGLEEYLNERPPIPGLLTLPGITPALVAHLYDLAAQFYRAHPWAWLDDAAPFELRVGGDPAPRYAVVIGSMGETFGLAVYDSAADLRRALREGARPTPGPPRNQLALILDDPRLMTFGDLDAMDEHGWTPVNPQAYPAFIRTTARGDLGAPTAGDLFWIEAALAAVLVYVRRLGPGPRGRVPPADEAIPVTTLSGERVVQLRVPSLPAPPPGRPPRARGRRRRS
ncbi:MAG TPA: hypothetical protein VKY74_07535 [Chloroflexia bacterium]|nr:hypothetical protein [Chloroflexia bacterium]